MSLNAELDVFRADFIGNVPAEMREAMKRADMELAAAGILEHGSSGPSLSTFNDSQTPDRVQEEIFQ